MTTRVYLAGPEVFLADARAIGARKRAICARYGLVGVFPADEEDACDPTLPPPEQGLAISSAMERVMQSCNAMIVNLTPFRGPSADVGSAYEMGFMRALGRPVFAYSNDARPFRDRVAACCGGVLRQRPSGEHEDLDGMAVERFDLCDNLMLAGGVISSGGCLVTAPFRRPSAIRRSPFSSAASNARQPTCPAESVPGGRPTALHRPRPRRSLRRHQRGFRDQNRMCSISLALEIR